MGIKMNIYLLLFILGSIFIEYSSGEDVCTKRVENCNGNHCLETTVCKNGICDSNGDCLCNACYQGPSCDEYVDLYGPRFAARWNIIVINPKEIDNFYRAYAEDKDLELTCVDSDPQACPCGRIYYFLDSNNGDHIFFTIDVIEGTLSRNKGYTLTPGKTYNITINARKTNDINNVESYLSMETTSLTIMVKDNSDLSEDEMEDRYNELVADENMLFEEHKLKRRSTNFTMEDHTRPKRNAPGVTTGDLQMEMSIVGGDITAAEYGQKIDVDVKIFLPELGSAMDMTAEFFVMDAVTGITPFRICSCATSTKGSAVSASADTPSMQPVKNSFLTDITDRWIFKYTGITNSATYTSGATDFSASLVSFTCTVIRIENADYLNSTVILSAGIEFDADTYVYVVQKSIDATTSSVAYPVDATITGEDAGKINLGASYTIEAFVTVPTGNLILELLNPSNGLDEFSYTSFRVKSIGSNFGGCGSDPPEPKVSFIKSPTRLTNNRVRMDMDYSLGGIDVANLASELTNVNNKLVFEFSVQFGPNTQEGDIVTFGGGLTVGALSIWTFFVNATMGAVEPFSDNAPTNYELVTPLLGSGTVEQFGAHTFQIKASLAPKSTAVMTCESAVAANHKVVGVKMGPGGYNLVTYPDIGATATYNDDGTASWTGVLVTADGTSLDTNEDYAIIEVTVQYLGTPGSVTVDCDGVSVILNGVSSKGTPSLLDLYGTVTRLTPLDTWYDEGQQGLLVEVTFPPGGVPYESVTLETAGDFAITAWSAEVCSVKLLEAGRGIAGMYQYDEEKMVKSLTTSSSAYLDGSTTPLGPIAGTELDDNEYHNTAVFQVVYTIPKGQALSADTYNMSVGFVLNEDVAAKTMIFTGWDSFTVDTAAYTIDTVNPPRLDIVKQPSASVAGGVPQSIIFSFKMIRGATSSLKFVANMLSASTSTLSICRVNIHAGRGYPCLDTDPYGKEIDPNQIVTLIHDATDWGLSATATLGVVTNLSPQPSIVDISPDDDSIVFEVIVKGMATGTDSLVGTMTVGTTDYTQNAEIIVASDPTPALTLEGFVTLEPITGTGNEVYADVMKQYHIVLDVPSGYQGNVEIAVSNADPAALSLCIIGVESAGINIPCLIPSHPVSARTWTETGETLTLPLGDICWADLSVDPEENKVKILLGVTLNGATDSSFDITIIENTVALATVISTTLTLSGDAYVADVNHTASGFNVQPLLNDTTVYPGYRFYLPIVISLPRETTQLLTIGVLCPSELENGKYRAKATAHGFRWGTDPDRGKNIGCQKDPSLYTPQIMQNSTIADQMWHESQTDTLILEAGYWTNTGLSEKQKVPKVEDDQIIFEAEILIADVPTLVDGDIITISFGIEYGETIIVYKKDLTLAKDPAPEPILISEFHRWDNTTDLYNSGDQVSYLVRLKHEMNVSTEEVNGACIRILTPQFFSYVEGSDTFSCNITNTVINNNKYIDFCFDYLFFTDILELNFTLTVNPEDKMTKGLGEVNATTLFRFYGVPGVATDPKYFPPTRHISVLVNGADCFSDLGVDSFLPCQFSASTAIDASTAPENVKPSSTGWSPAVRSGYGWTHYITIDFLKKTRITQITFSTVTGRSIESFKLKYSYGGVMFMDVCDDVLQVTAPVVTLPTNCRVVTRYLRLLVVSASGADELVQIQAKFSVQGCAIDTVDGVCQTTTALNTLLTSDGTKWRHAAYDPVNAIIYFCDHSMKKKRLVCYSSPDGATWNALPSYVGHLIGFDGASEKMCAKDKKNIAMVCSSNGIDWGLVDAATATTIEGSAVAPNIIPGKGSDLGNIPITGSSYIANFDGLTLSGAYKVKWASCCT